MRGACAALALVALQLAVAGTGSDRAEARARSSARPNVLIIVTDDQRIGTLRAMPTTRRWFEQGGTHFTRAFATTPLCCPSRASILTGRYAHNHGVRNNHGSISNLDQRSTIESYLQDARYSTALFGKYFSGWDLATSPPYFDDWAIFLNSARHYMGGNWNVDGLVRPVKKYATNFIARRALHFVSSTETNDARPWFMVLAPPAPHSPYTPQPRYARAPVRPWGGDPAVFERDRSDKPQFVQARSVSFRKAQRIRTRQFRTLLSVDDLVKRVFGKLGELDERRPTLAFFLSDNGYLWGEHGLGGSVFGKRPPYTESVRLPMLMRWPDHVARGAADRRLVANIDLAPTILDAAGITPSAQIPMDGMSLLSNRTRDHLLLEYWIDVGTTPDWGSIVTPDLQYIEYYGLDGLTPTFREYYDLRRDPWQLDNLLGDRVPGNDPDVTGLSAQLAADRRCAGAGCP